MATPKTIIYSRNLYRTLLGRFGTKMKTRIGRETISRVPEPCDIVLHRRQIGPKESTASAEKLRRLPEIDRRSITLEKIVLGEGVHLADPADAHGLDLKLYETIIFDLDFDLNDDAALRVAELVTGLSREGNYQTPALWRDIAATAALTIVFVQAKTTEESPYSANNTLLRGLTLLAGLALPKSRVTDNYDLLPMNLVPFDSANLGCDLAQRYRILPDLPVRNRKLLDRWMTKATAFRFVNTLLPPPAGMRYLPIAELSDRGAGHTVAGACQVGRSIVGFVPAADLESLDWLKSIVDLAKTLFQGNLFIDVVDNSARPRMKLIARKFDLSEDEKPGTAIISLEIAGEPIKMMIPERPGKKGPRDFNLKHLELLQYHANLQKKGFLDKALPPARDRKVRKQESNLLFDLRSAAEETLKAAHLAAAIADDIFPPKTFRIDIPIQIISDRDKK